jgi:5-methyltetrahydropteroyltriglutamate--homocysteine methyltransferase
MKRSSARILTTHAGSLIRPAEIVEAMIQDHLSAPLDKEKFNKDLQVAVEDIVKKQADVGIDVIDDGEFGKSSWIAYLADRFDGFVRVSLPREILEAPSPVYGDFKRFAGFYQIYGQIESRLWLPDAPSKSQFDGNQTSEYAKAACVGPLRYKPEALQRDIAKFKAALKKVQVEEAFLPVVAPASVEVIFNKYYKTAEEYLFAVADALNTEYKMIVEAGFLLQIDDAMLPMMRFMAFGGRSVDEFHRWAQMRIDALNHALRGIPEDRVRYHVCFGSQNVPHTFDPSLTDILDLILQIKAQAYSIEASNPRHEHEWQVWEGKKLPEGKILIPGVISHATNVVEHPELIALRLKNFARLVGRENVIAGTDCSFSQSWSSPRVHVEIQWAKLEALVEGARLASRDLWGKASERAA